MSENQLYSELNKVYVLVAAMNGYIAEFQRQVDDILATIDALQNRIDAARIVDAEIALAEKDAEVEHLGNNGEPCTGCTDEHCVAATVDLTDYIEAK